MRRDGAGTVAGKLARAVNLEERRFVRKLYPALSPAVYMSLQMRLHLGYWPNLRHPRSYNEKMVHGMLFAPHPLASVVADKWRVREHVAGLGLESLLNDVYFVTDDPERIPFDTLPDRFVVKANHGCGWNIMVTDRDSMDRAAVVRQCRDWLGRKYGRESRTYETHYDSIRPRILVERFLPGEDGPVPLDFKFLCFHGEPTFAFVCRGRFGARATDTFYDMDWRVAPFRKVRPVASGEPKPAMFAEMRQAAAALSRGFDYVRVDLYLVRGRIVFGELTLTPLGGLGRFEPREWDFRLGELW